MKKILAFFLLIFITFSAVGCVPSADDPYEGLIPDGYTADTVGYNYTIVCDTEADSTLVPAYGTLIGDRLLAHYSAIEEQYSCIISTEEMIGEKISSKILASAASDIKFADLVQTDAVTISQLYSAGYLSALEEIPFIDPTSEKWGLESQKEFMTFDGKTYGFFGLWLGASFPTVSGVMLYNRDLLTEFSVSDPMELYENGKWNWNSFTDIAKKVTVNSGDDSGTYAFALPNATYPDFIHSAILSNGGSRYVEKQTESGGLECGYTSYATIDALTWVRGLVNDSRVAYPMKMEYDNGYLDVLAFTNRRTLFLVTNSYDGVCSYEDYPLATFGDECGWLPFPKGPAVEGKVNTAYFGADDTFCAVAVKDTQSLYNGGQILNSIFECMEGDDPTTWKEALYDGYFFDEKSFNLYFDMLSTAKDVGQIREPSLNAPIDAKLAAVISGEESVAKAVEELENVIEGYLE